MTKAQIQASDPEYSVWVAASAGTGKTTVLTARVLRLLLGGTNPGKILCLTYTKAGAAEMESRIKLKLCSWVTLSEENLVAELTRLSGIVPNNEIIKRARELFLKTLDTPDGIKIQTIHSFCQGLMRRFPLEAGIMPHFKVMDDKTSKELLKEARTRLLSNSNSYKTSVEVASAIKNIFWRIREGTFSAVIEAIIEDRDKFENALEKAGSVTSLQAAIYKLLGVPEGCNEEDIIYQATLEKSFDRDALKNCALGLLEQSRKTFVKLGKILCSWLEQDAANRVQHFDEYKKAFFTQKNEPRKDLTPAKGKVPIAPMLAEQARLQKVSNDIKSTRVAVLSSSMVEIANAILKIYGEEKSSRAFMDYADLIMKSENLLLKDDIAPWVLYKLDGGIDHILLDEAQDTSPQQWNIIDSLCAEFFAGNGARDVERTIFVVGDEKQSIFSFQGAAPHIFNKMQEKFRQRVGQAGKKWRSVRLDESFRSSPVILQAVDAVGESLRAESREPGDGKLETNETIHRDNLKNNEVNSIVSSQHRQAYSAHIAHHKEMFGRVEIWPLIEPAKTEAEIGWVMPLEYKDKQDTRKILAEQIADMIKEWLDSGRILESEGRPVSAGDIIILLRKRRKMADNIISSLKKRGVAVAGHDRLVITEHIAVMDLMALGNFLLLPQDDLSLACVLKSPLIGLSEEKLFEISYKRGGKSLWNALREVQGNENNGNYAYSYLSNLLSKVDFLTPFGLYCHILEALGGRKKLIRRLGYEVNDPVDEFLSMALAYEKSHAPSLQGFLSWLESGKSEIKRDLEQSGSDTVRVMTVHASKGLEAPIIIMPDTISDFATSKDKIFWHEQQQGQGHIMLWPGGAENLEDVCNLIKRNSKDEQSQEYYRLLYVAMTRAKSELYIMGALGGKARPKGCWYDVIISALEGAASKGEDGVLRLIHGTKAIKRQAPEQQPEERIKLPEYAQQNPLPEPTPTHPLMPSRMHGDAVTGNYKESSSTKIIEGRIIHDLLEFLPDIQKSERMAVGRKFLAKRISGFGVDIELILHKLIDIMQMEVLEDVFGKNSRAEVPIVGVLGGLVVSARIDRLCVLDDRVIIVDYKTGAANTKAQINKGYIRQMEIYMELIQKIYPEKHIECYIIWTETCQLHKIVRQDDFESLQQA